MFTKKPCFRITSITYSAVCEGGGLNIGRDDLRPALDAWKALKEECINSLFRCYYVVYADAAVGTGLSSVGHGFKI